MHAHHHHSISMRLSLRVRVADCEAKPNPDEAMGALLPWRALTGGLAWGTKARHVPLGNGTADPSPPAQPLAGRSYPHKDIVVGHNVGLVAIQ